MRSLVVLLCVCAIAGARLRAQEPIPTPPVHPESLKVDSTRVDSTLPVVLTPAQEKYLAGLRTAGRGIAQLKTGVDRMVRAQASRDSLRQRRAGHLLSGYCGTARSFLVSGRGQMQFNAYEDSTRLKARRLTVAIDTLIKFTPTCEAQAGKTPAPVTADLVARLRSYEAILRDFRLAVGLPVKPDSVTRKPL